jgi:hypothetical protein
MITFLAILLGLSLAFNVYLVYLMLHFGDKWNRLLERQENKALAERQELISRIQHMKGYREYAPPPKTLAAVPPAEELKEESEIEGFLPYT